MLLAKSINMCLHWLVHAIELRPENNKECGATNTYCASRMSYLLCIHMYWYLQRAIAQTLCAQQFFV